MDWSTWLALGAVIVAVAAVVMGFVHKQALEDLRRKVGEIAGSGEKPVAHNGPPVVIYNPSKSADFEKMREVLHEAAQDAGLKEPVWIPTTEEDSGEGQAREALTHDPSVVIAAGGDGTVRLVGGVLAGTGVPMGIFPFGTGNLLARNLELPIDELRNLASIALTGRNRRIDVGWMKAGEITAADREAIQQHAGEAELFEGEVPFIVIAGMGFDAQVMGDTDSKLKKVVGWIAYVIAGMRHLNDERIEAQITAGTGDNPVDVTARSIMFANCGTLTAGLVLAPDAKVDDGWLDIAVVDTKGGIVGWTDLARRVGLQQFGMEDKLLPEAGSIDFRRTRNVSVHTDELVPVQADGDVVGLGRDVSARIDEGALIVRVR
ncbi:diacylglycerol kinase [Arcanobacterium haemolyticum]|nr:diacylglycerol kinase [Arcanobacterium haemolyticum]